MVFKLALVRLYKSRKAPVPLSVAGICSFFSHIFLYLFLAGLAAYALLSAYSAAKSSSSIKQTFQVMKAFFILHFSYGTGYLQGVIDFFIFQKQIKKEEVLTR